MSENQEENQSESTQSGVPENPAHPPLPEKAYPEDALRLIKMLRDAEEEIASFRTQLEDDLASDEKLILQAQHEEIDQLEGHLKDATVHWRDVYDFLRQAFAPLRAKLTRND